MPPQGSWQSSWIGVWGIRCLEETDYEQVVEAFTKFHMLKQKGPKTLKNQHFQPLR